MAIEFTLNGKPQSVDDIVNGTIGRALARLGIDNEAYTRWKGMGESE